MSDGRIAGRSADLTQPGEPKRLVARAEAALGGVVLVACVGGGWAGRCHSMPPGLIDEEVHQ